MVSRNQPDGRCILVDLLPSCAMILVTGAGGKTGRAVIRALARRGREVRALAYRRAQAPMLDALGAREVVVGDVQDPETVATAAAGIRAIYQICPNMHPREEEIGGRMIQAARAVGCERLVYHSVLHPQTEAMPHHWHKLRVEEKLLESGLGFTVLQPAAYMQNVLAGWREIIEDGVYAVPYAAATRISWVDLGDVAEAAARVLTEPGHDGATYQLSGPGFLTQTEVAAVLGEGLGRELRLEVVPLDVWKSGARAAGLDEFQVGTLAKMFRYYERHGLRGNPRVLGWLLGREPVSFRQFVERATRDHKST